MAELLNARITLDQWAHWENLALGPEVAEYLEARDRAQEREHHANVVADTQPAKPSRTARPRA